MVRSRLRTRNREKYIKKAAALYYGLNLREVRILAYQFATTNSKVVPRNWKMDEKAGADWFSAFMKKHPNLSIRVPESTSIARAIYNIDVQRPSRIIAQKGVKQVGAIVSQERGQMVTLAVAVNALGKSIPPAFVFSRVDYKDHIIRQPGSLGLAYPSGLAQDAWMKNNPGRSMTIYDIPEIVNKAFSQAATPVNICSGFRVAGVYPFQRDIFQDDEYTLSYTTDHLEMCSKITERQNGEPVTANETPTTIQTSFVASTIVSTANLKPTNNFSTNPERDTVLTQISRKTAKVSEKQKKSKNNIPIITSDDNTPCHFCGILANVPPFENWKECPYCKEWCHEHCCLEDSILCYSCLG
ncbi:hypothetical protein HELRODRAFT_163910 [Helobdella robusta]|uniref:HTH CENPB-type domain-containing protein n=1 Tax=Helobdella robusta TaxID=6412 RepID=T1EUL9_HELRO|nr:hypothetical protein HELRODRAFT_163910 [Helobdella robusta]ESN96787.1 hypothetical protein HELRODRAFT_163910 [Helobdella robusta]